MDTEMVGGLTGSNGGGLNGKPLKKIKRIYNEPVGEVILSIDDEQRMRLTVVESDGVAFVGVRMFRYSRDKATWYPSFKNGMFLRFEYAVELLPALSKLISNYQTKNQVIKSEG